MRTRFDFGRRSKRSVGSVEKLLKDVLEITPEELERVLALNDEKLYREKIVKKSDGSDRIVYDPHQSLRKIQRRINRRFFYPRNQSLNSGLLKWPCFLYGSVPSYHSKAKYQLDSRDYVACASRHCGAKSLMKMDISNFFDNIHEEHVRNIFVKLFAFPPAVSNVLVELCCYRGSLVQGALTSSFIASTVLFDIEGEIVKRLRNKKLTYTRLVDDITVSSMSPDYDFSFAQKIITDMLVSKDLPVNESKTIISRSLSQPLMVHGLRVNFTEPRLPSEEVSRIRASVKHLESLAKDPKYRTSRDYRKSFNRCMGRVNKLGRLGHRQHTLLIERVMRIPPLPSKKDIPIATAKLKKLSDLYEQSSSEYFYYKLYCELHSELNILQRTFQKTSHSLRLKLRELKPTYEH